MEGAKWQGFFVSAGIPSGISAKYAKSFEENRITRDMLSDLDKATLAELGIKAIGDQLAVLKKINSSKKTYAQQTPITPEVQIKQTRVVRNPISAPPEDPCSSIPTASESRKGRPPPDRHEIYHVKMPSGNTAKTRSLLQTAEKLKRAGVLKRGHSGVRQGGRPVSPISKDRDALMLAGHNKLTDRAQRFESEKVGGLYSDKLQVVRVNGGRIVKKSSSVSTLFSKAITLASVAESPRVRVRIPVAAPQQSSSASDLPRVTVNLSSGSLGRPIRSERTIPRSVERKPRPSLYERVNLPQNRSLPALRSLADEDDEEMEEDSQVVYEYEEGDYDGMEFVEIEEDEATRPRPSIYSRIKKINR